MSTARSAVLVSLTVLVLSACSGGTDPSPSDVGGSASAEQALTAPTGPGLLASAAPRDDGHSCDSADRRNPAMFLQRFDANHDGKLQLTEVPERMRAFVGKADTNGDGLVTADEIAAQHAAIRAEARDPATMVRRLDDNHDGKLQLKELPERRRERLGAADTNRDGILSTDELAAHRTHAEERRFARKDANGDGAITADEVSPRRWDQFAAADADKDGRVTLKEMEAAFANGTLRMPRHGFRHERTRAPDNVMPTKS